MTTGILLLMAALLLAASASYFKKYYASDWTKTIGIITHSEAFTYADNDGDKTEGIEVNYKYYVDQKELHDQGLTLIGNTHVNPSVRTNRRPSKKYPVGKKIEVWYQSHFPHRSEIEHGIQYRYFFFTILGFLLIYLAFNHN